MGVNVDHDKANARTQSPAAIASAAAAGYKNFTAFPIVFGSASVLADDTLMQFARNVTGVNAFAHAIQDRSQIAVGGGSTTGAYASFDSWPTMSGTIHYNHLHSFQGRPEFAGSGTIDEVASFTSQGLNSSTGTVTSFIGLRIFDPLNTGGGAITTKYGIYIDPMTGPHLAIFSLATGASYLAGNLQLGSHLDLIEMTAPPPSADRARLFAQDNGAGKTQLMVQFGSGAAIQLAIQP